MEIYIDKQKIKLRKNKNDIEKLLKYITENLEKENKVIENIYLNGNKVDSDIIIDMNAPNVLEVETKSRLDILLENLDACVEHIIDYFEVKEFLDTKMTTSQEITKDDLADTFNFLNWLSYLNYSLEEFLTHSEDNTFIEKTEILAEEIEVFSKKFDAKKYNDCVNYLTENVDVLLEEYYRNIKNYRDMIIKEENSKKYLV